MKKKNNEKDFTMTFGRYKGKSIKEVYKENSDYIDKLYDLHEGKEKFSELISAIVSLCYSSN